MKPLFTITDLIAFSFVILAFVPAEQETKRTASPQMVSGLYIYYKSIPNDATEYLGTVKFSLVMTNKASDCLDKLVKNCKKDYPQAQALVITDADFQKADAVRFK